MLNELKKIIAVDDDVTNLNTLKTVLKPLYEVYTAPSAAILFKFLDNIVPDLILLDVEMPNINGYETIKKLKADERYSEIPVIFLTAKDDEVSEQEGFNLGASDYVTKPFSAPLLAKRIENQLIIVSRTKELKAALSEAKNTSLAKGSFLANMSHEIRTPMNAIIGMAQVAAKTEDMEKLKYCLSMIENSSTHLLGIINDILDMSKIEAGKLELEHTSFNMKNMMIRVSNLFAEKIEFKNIRFNIITGAKMGRNYIGDELRLSQVIVNLLGNAVKFTPENGKIELMVDEKEIESGFSVLQFTVRDTGIGMTDEQMSKLFNVFVQAETGTSRKYGGTGLGLTISKSIVEKMDGKIWVDSVPGEGSAFTFEVKLKKLDKRVDRTHRKNILSKNVRLLIIDNDIHETDYLKIIIDNFGIVPEIAENLEQATEYIRAANSTHRPYDVILMDYNFIDSGSADKIKSMGEESDISHIIVMSSFLHWNKVGDMIKNIGIGKYIAKPLFPSAILNSINEVTGGTIRSSNVETEVAEGMPNFRGVTLLLAEDVEINQEIFISLLEETGISIDVADNGLIALEKFKQSPERYDMIIMDVQMPEMDGYEATLAIRSLGTERAKNIPIIAMTANVFKEDIERCLESGMSDHLSKPIEIDAVIKKITLYCGDGTSGV